MLGQPAAKKRISFTVDERVEQWLVGAALIELAEGVGANGVVGFEQSQQTPGRGVA